MARPKRRRLKFDEESVNNLLQEIYDETHNQKAKITRLFSKWESKIKETGEVAAIGDQIVKLIAAEAKNQEQKIMLLRYLKEVVYDKKNIVGSNVDVVDEKRTSGDISSEKRNELLNFVHNELEKRGDK